MISYILLLFFRVVYKILCKGYKMRIIGENKKEGDKVPFFANKPKRGGPQ